MKTLLAVLLISTAALIGCGKSTAVAAVAPPAQELKHGYELAKTWDLPTRKAKVADARRYYDSEAPVTVTQAGLQLQLDENDYELCANRAQIERLCKLPNEATKECGPDAIVLGPSHIARCDKLIDELPVLIEKRDAALRAELKQ